ncbi:uncharacterized protein AB675_8354 [Cyphellophora attinorum]|uniref:Transcription factor domain-containing protein n=1 Tax=Cyphellophora attinorum TaxID=1664694 RepID=A0A0N1HF99_9EURO|nr:uncharacterized protein AB675_8354 [Phialophora attinorum]KPI44363.1 hypothetical protein AB675_8354 [Phialophora attinorum]
MIPPRTFLFINHGLQSDDERPQFRDLMVHISNSHKKWLKKQRDNKLKQKPLAARLEWRITSRPRSEVVFRLDGVEKKAVGRRSDGTRLRAVTDNEVGDETGSTDSSSDGCIHRRTGGKASITSPRGSPARSFHTSPRTFKGNSDPFAAAAIDLCPLSTAAIASSGMFIVFQSRPSELHSLLRTHISDYANSGIDFAASVSSSAELHALIAAGFYIQSRASHDGKHFRARSIGHTCKAINLLREQLHQSASLAEHTKLINLIMSLDCATGNLASADKHLRSLIGLYQKGIHIGDALHSTLQACDGWLSSSLRRVPLFDQVLHDPGPLSAQWWSMDPLIARVVDCSLPVANADVLYEFNPTIYGRKIDFRHVQIINSILVSQQPFLGREEAVNWIVQRTPIVVHFNDSLSRSFVKLASLREAEHRPYDAARSYLEAAVSLALLLGSSLVYIYHTSALDYGAHLTYMDSLLDKASQPRQSDNISTRLVYLWENFVHAIMMDICAGKQSCAYSARSLLRVQQIFMDMNVTELDAKRAILRRSDSVFNYIPDIAEEFVATLHSEEPRDRNMPLLSERRWEEVFRNYTGRRAAEKDAQLIAICRRALKWG